MSRVLEDGRFIEELCRKVLRYYSFEGDAVLDPFAGSRTFGMAARKMGRIPVLCEIREDYADIIEGESGRYYDVRGRSGKKTQQKRSANYYVEMITVMKLLTRSTRYS